MCSTMSPQYQSDLWNLTGVTAKWFSVENSAENSPPIASVWVEILDVQDPQSDGKHGK